MWVSKTKPREKHSKMKKQPQAQARPNFFIVGEPKCGSTTIHDMLDQHPEIFMSNPKEIGYFRTDISAKRWTLQEYLSIFSNVGDEKIVGESSVNYMLSSDAAKNIFEFNKDAKILMLFRAPAEFLCSLHSQFVYNLMEKEEDFEKALDSSKPSDKVKIPLIMDYWERARFYYHAKRFFDIFPRENIMVMAYEKFAEDPSGTYEDILSFLGVEKRFIPEMLHKNPNKHVRAKGIKQILDSIKITRIRRLLPQKIYGAGAALFRKTIVRNTERRQIALETEHKIRKRTRGQVRMLSELTGEDFLSMWNYNTKAIDGEGEKS